MTASEPLGAADCERLGNGWVLQPANTASSGLLALVGLWLVVRSLRVDADWSGRAAAAAYGAATVAAGLGSVDYHGLHSPAAQWTHDGGAALLIGAAVLVPLWRRVRGRAAVPGWTSARGVGLVAIAAVAVLAHLGGRTIAPLCDPDSPLQLHSLWHVGIAGAAAVWAVVLWPGARRDVGPAELGWAGHPWLHRLVRTVTLLVYRHIDADDLSDLDDGPVVVVSNHFGGLADALVLMAALPRRPRILADDAIWRIPVARTVMRAIGAVPVHRGRSGSDDNSDMFAATAEALRAGDLVLLFPEGITREEPSIGRVRTGAARIALGAGVPVRVAAVGLHYAEASGFRTDVVVRRGPDDVVEPRPEEPRAAVEELTGWIDGALRRCAPDYEDWDEVAALRRAAEVALGSVDGHERNPTGQRERLAAAYAALPDPAPARVVEAVGRFESRVRGRHRRLLAGGTTAVLATVLAWLVALPYAALGLGVFGVPLVLAVAATRLPVSAPVRATVVPVVATLGCAVAAVLATVAAWGSGGWRLVGLTWALLPVTAASLLFVAERAVPVLHAAASVVRGPRAADVAAARRELLAELELATGVEVPR